MRKALLSVLLVVLLISLFGVMHAQEKKPYKVGAIFAVTGRASWLGDPEKKTVEMIVEEVNKKGGINGHPLEVIVEDTAGTEEKTKTKVLKLIEKDGVCAIIGPSRTGCSMAVIEDVTRAKVPLLSCAGASVIVEREEEADAWSVMQTPLFVLAVITVIGGFFIWFTSICEPDYEASGRRAGLKTLLNWLGYTIGPIWMSVAVGSLASIVLGLMVFQLIKRPIRQVLEYSN